MVKSFETIREARVKYCKLTLEDLQSISVKVLRAMAVEIDAKSAKRGEEYVPLSTARKNELIDAIYETTAETRALLVNPEDFQNDVAIATELVASELDELSKTDLGTMAEKHGKRLINYSKTLFDDVSGTWKERDGTFRGICDSVVDDLRYRRSSITGESLQPSTIIRYKTSVMNAIRDMVEGMRDSAYYNGILENYNSLELYVTQAFRMLNKQVLATTSENLGKRKTHASIIKVDGLFEWACNVLTQLDPDEPNERRLWLDVACALIIVTGRRTAEVLSSAEFVVIDKPLELTIYDEVFYVSDLSFDQWVMFSGQLKTKEDDGRAPYAIPVLARSEDVVKGLTWLHRVGKRAVNPDVAHSKYSKEIGLKFKQLDGKIVWVKRNVYVKNNKEHRLTPHFCRQIYGQFIKTEATKLNVIESKFMSIFLGHGDADSKTTASYDADVILMRD